MKATLAMITQIGLILKRWLSGKRSGHHPAGLLPQARDNAVVSVTVSSVRYFGGLPATGGPLEL
jgi:hypothetical protein